MQHYITNGMVKQFVYFKQKTKSLGYCLKNDKLDENCVILKMSYILSTLSIPIRI